MKSGFIAIVGRPNAGKSTLLNSMLGTPVSIVTPKAQTTRERVLGILTETAGQIVFVDTPGIHKAKDGGINAYMMSEATAALEAPSAVWYLVDPASARKHEEPVISLVAASRAPVFLLMNKADLLKGAEPRAQAARLADEVSAELTARGAKVQRVLLISASRGSQLKELREESWGLLPEGPLYYPDSEQVSDRPMRYFVAEKIREQLLLCLGEEIPYSCAVEITKYEDPKEGDAKPLVRIEAVVHVERDSQKGMVVGKGGLKIKEIGSRARTEIESFIGSRAFLGLQVKVLKDWSRDADALRRMGYNISSQRS